jgi:hypothetical protein
MTNLMISSIHIISIVLYTQPHTSSTSSVAVVVVEELHCIFV